MVETRIIFRQPAEFSLNATMPPDDVVGMLEYQRLYAMQASKIRRTGRLIRPNGARRANLGLS